VLFGRAGLAAAARPGTLIIDQSSGDPIATRSMAQRLAVSGVTLIDAPVSGTAAAAEAGTMTIMVGASDEQFARAEPVLAAISRNIFHAGDVGSGQVMKLVNNVLSGGSRLLVMESVALATKNGIDPHRACEILQAGGARSAFLETFMIPHILKGDLSPGFTLDLMHKDVGLACQLGKNTGVPMFFGNLAQEFYKMCIKKLGRRAQVNTAALVMDSMCGTHVVPAPGAVPDAA
jgi:3-hydroxyisobutyrate dehydrogenase